jgi:hypothetical protein
MRFPGQSLQCGVRGSKEILQMLKILTKASFLATLAALLIVGCAPNVAEPPIPLPNARTYPASFDKVWSAMVSNVSADFPIQASDKASGLLTTRFISLGDGNEGWSNLLRFAYQPPGGFLPNWSLGGRYTLTFYVASADAYNTTIRITARFEAVNSVGGWTPWATNGVLESTYLDKIGAAIRP